MGKKSGKAGSPVSPAAPDKAEDADTAVPGEVARIEAKSTKPHKPPATEEEADKKSWIEIELVDEDDEPVPGEKYKITLPDDSVAEGTLDNNGFAHIGGIEPGTCKITFPELDKDAWEKA